MHVDNIKSFICPTNANTNYSKIVELLKTLKTAVFKNMCQNASDVSVCIHSLSKK